MSSPALFDIEAAFELDLHRSPEERSALSDFIANGGSPNPAARYVQTMMTRGHESRSCLIDLNALPAPLADALRLRLAARLRELSVKEALFDQLEGAGSHAEHVSIDASMDVLLVD